MSRLRLNKVANPTQAAPAGKVEVFTSNDTPSLFRTNDESNNIVTLTPINNYAVTSQTPAATTRALRANAVTTASISTDDGSSCPMPPW